MFENFNLVLATCTRLKLGPKENFKKENFALIPFFGKITQIVSVVSLYYKLVSVVPISTIWFLWSPI